MNLYGMVSNDPVNKWDLLGLVDCCGDKVYNPDKECCKNEVIIPGQSKADCDHARAALNALNQMINTLNAEIQALQDSINTAHYIENVSNWNWDAGNFGLTVSGIWIKGGPSALASRMDIFGTAVGIAGGYHGNPAQGALSLFGLPDTGQLETGASTDIMSHALSRAKARQTIRKIREFIKENCGKCEK